MEDHLKRYNTNKLPVVIPLVIYNGEIKYPYSMDWLDLFEDQSELARDIYSKPFVLVDLSQIAEETFRQHARAGLMEWCLKCQAQQQVMQSIHVLVALLEQSVVRENHNYLLQTIQYMVYNLDSEGVDVFINLIKNHLPQPISENMMTIAERLIQRGDQQGFQRGEVLGFQRGEVQTLLDLMKYKFEFVSNEYHVRVANADEQHVRIWLRNILKANTLDEVFEETKSK